MTGIIKTSKYLLIFSILLMLTGCESKAIREAKEAYEASDYAAVVSLLSSEEIEDPEVIRILTESKAHVAFDNQDYLETVKLLQSMNDEEVKEYQIYKDACQKLVDSSVEDKNSDLLAEIYSLENNLHDYIYQVLTAPCDQLSYESFVFLEEFANKLQDSELKDSINQYLSDNANNRIRAFLIGEWEWQSDNETKTRINIMPYQDNLLGEVTQVGDNEIEYQILVGDIYWKDFEFIDAGKFTCYNLGKTRIGSVVDCTALCEIDYDEDLLKMHITAPEPYITVNADRDWKRIE